MAGRVQSHPSPPGSNRKSSHARPLGPVPLLFLSFSIAALVICVTPGSDMVYVISYGVSRGRLGGLAAALGVAVGMGAHSVLAALGIALLIGRSDAAMTAMSVVGASYLAFMLMGLTVDSVVGLASGGIASALVKNPSVVRRVNTVCGGVMCGLALLLGAGIFT